MPPRTGPTARVSSSWRRTCRRAGSARSPRASSSAWPWGSPDEFGMRPQRAVQGLLFAGYGRGAPTEPVGPGFGRAAGLGTHQHRAGRVPVAADELQGQAVEVVLAGFHGAQVEAFDDYDPRRQERVVHRVLEGRVVAFDGEVVDADQQLAFGD